MSCEKCDKVQDDARRRKSSFFMRIGRAHVEILACEEHFVPVTKPYDPKAYPWNQVAEGARRKRLEKQLADKLRKMRLKE